jgi:integrase
VAANNKAPYRLHRRGQIWHARFSFRIQGREDFFVDRRSTGHDNYEEAQQWCIEFIHKIKSAPEITNEITFDDAAARWIVEVVKYQKKPETTAGRIKYLRNEFPTQKLLSQITKADITNFIETCRVKERSPATINRYLSVISAIFTRAKDFWDCNSPKFKVSQFYLKEPKENIKYFKDMDTIDKILSVTKKEHFKTLILLTLYTGFRPSTSLALKWGQVDLDAGYISYIGKDGKRHAMPIVPQLKQLLTGIKRHGDYVITFKGKPIQYYNKTWCKIAKKAGIPYQTFYTLRHTTATWLHRAGVPIKVIQDIMGHSDINTTMKYAHLYDGAQEQALNDLFSQNLHKT